MERCGGLAEEFKLERRSGNEHSFIGKMQLGVRVRTGLKEFSFVPHTGSVLM